MAAKTTAVTLVVGGVTRMFEFSHAERLLRMRKNGGWHLPENSKFEFVDYALRHKRVAKKDRKA